MRSIVSTLNDPKLISNVLRKVDRDLFIMNREIKVGEHPLPRIWFVYLGACNRYLKNADLL